LSPNCMMSPQRLRTTLQWGYGREIHFQLAI